MEEETLFHLAVEKPADQRGAFLRQACAGDLELQQRVITLLEAHENPATFMQPPVERLQPITLDPPMLSLPPGTIIGRYKLLEPIGEGGYGVVFMAEQTSPVVRNVALKIIKAGMDTRQVIARFEAERQALALMDHPNIAKVFDAGVTDAGRPYFVMELVKGVSIVKYCDQHRLPPRARLELFVQVCHAVQHAHTKGIIHRDLKPSNVLIALYDGKPVPKVIDFGVAKATGQKLTELTMFTSFGDVIGTLEYMSPEQAEVNQLDVDTRSDVYSLGVLLYELLTGTTPLEHNRVMKAGLLEMLRAVREEEAPRPSTRLGASEQLPSIAANRGIEPKKLSGLLHGELDWIVMKSLEKDRDRRYETASGFATDVQRYLSNETVQACPASATYRMKKFIRRHKVSVLTGSTVVAALVVGLVAASIGFFEARRQTRIAREHAAHADLALAMVLNAEAKGNSKEAERLARGALAIHKELFGDDDNPKVCSALHVLAFVLAKRNPDEAIALERESIRRRRKSVVPISLAEYKEYPDLAPSLDNLAGLLLRKGEVVEAEALYREALPIWRSFLGNDHVYVANTLDHLAASVRNQGKQAEAENYMRECLAIRERVLGHRHGSTVIARRSLIDLLKKQGKDAEVEKLIAAAAMKVEAK
jgi:serine/threonine protein kinase